MEKCNLAYAHLRGILCSLSSSWTWTGILIIGIHRGRKNLIAKHIHIWSQLPGWPCPRHKSRILSQRKTSNCFSPSPPPPLPPAQASMKLKYLCIDVTFVSRPPPPPTADDLPLSSFAVMTDFRFKIEELWRSRVSGFWWMFKYKALYNKKYVMSSAP